MPSTLDPDNRFISWLEQELVTRGWTRQKLAEEAGIYPSVLGRVVNREVGLGPDVAKKLAAALGVSQYEVFRRAGLIDEELLDDDKAAQEYLRLLAAIDDDDERQEAIDTVETILRRIAERRKAPRPRSSSSPALVKRGG